MVDGHEIERFAELFDRPRYRLIELKGEIYRFTDHSPQVRQQRLEGLIWAWFTVLMDQYGGHPIDVEPVLRAQRRLLAVLLEDVSDALADSLTTPEVRIVYARAAVVDGDPAPRPSLREVVALARLEQAGVDLRVAEQVRKGDAAALQFGVAPAQLAAIRSPLPILLRLHVPQDLPEQLRKWAASASPRQLRRIENWTRELAKKDRVERADIELPAREARWLVGEVMSKEYEDDRWPDDGLISAQLPGGKRLKATGTPRVGNVVLIYWLRETERQLKAIERKQRAEALKPLVRGPGGREAAEAVLDTISETIGSAGPDPASLAEAVSAMDRIAALFTDGQLSEVQRIAVARGVCGETPESFAEWASSLEPEGAFRCAASAEFAIRLLEPGRFSPMQEAVLVNFGWNVPPVDLPCWPASDGAVRVHRHAVKKKIESLGWPTVSAFLDPS